MADPSPDEWTTIEVAVKDTAAFRIIRQITDHTWGSDVDLADADIVSICSDFRRRGGSWESLMNGDLSNIVRLEQSIDGLVAPSQMMVAASGLFRGVR